MKDIYETPQLEIILFDGDIKMGLDDSGLNNKESNWAEPDMH